MPDDPNKKGKQDRTRVSQQEHEKRYQEEKGREGSGGNSKKGLASADKQTREEVSRKGGEASRGGGR